MKIAEKEIRVVRDNKIWDDEYWVNIEILIDGKWIHPYFANEEILDWHEPRRRMNPTESNMKEYLKKQFKLINELLDKGYNLVSYDKFKEVVHRYHNPTEYEPKVVYL